MKSVSILACLALAAVLSACASTPQSRYYTLSGAAQQPPSAAPHEEGRQGLQWPGDARKPSSTAVSANFAISVSSVEVPQQVDRPQIVLSREGDAQVMLLNDSQWAAPLADEMRNALAQDLSRRLGVLEIEPRAAPAGLPLWVLAVTVQRFESVYGRRAVLEATWRQAPRQGARGPAAVCRAAIEVPVQDGMSALVEGHQRAVDTLAGLMADKLSGRPLEAGPGVTLKGCA